MFSEEFKRETGNWHPEYEDSDETERNLVAALRQLEPLLLQTGIIRVKTEVAGFAKDLVPLSQLEINLGSGLSSIALIGLIFEYKNAEPKKIFVAGWNRMGDHLSGPATVEVFVERISGELGLEQPATQEAENKPFDWDTWGEETDLVKKDIFSKEFLLSDFPQLGVKEIARDANGNNAYYHIFVISKPERIVVKFGIAQVDIKRANEERSGEMAEAFKQRIIGVIKEAQKLQEPQWVYLTPV